MPSADFRLQEKKEALVLEAMAWLDRSELTQHPSLAVQSTKRRSTVLLERPAAQTTHQILLTEAVDLVWV